MSKKTSGRTYFDYSLLFVVIFIILFGLVMMYSASYNEAVTLFEDPYYFLKRQAGSTLLGLVVMAGIIVFPYQKLNRPFLAILAYIMALVLIMLVITPIGVEANHARRWIKLGIVIQPSEVAKFCVIFFMAHFISRYAAVLRRPFVFYLAAFLILVVAGFVALFTKNLSSAMVIAGIGFGMLFVAAPRWWYFIPLVAIAVIAFVGLLIKEPYRVGRFKIWLHPEENLDDGGYQIMQSLYALGSGGIFGKGLGKGVQKLYIPEAQNDMVFTVVCEELGLVGAAAVILMFLFMLWRFLVIANNAMDLFGSMLVAGVMIHIAIHVALNIAVVTNALPNTGVTLPFISYGGSSSVILLAEIGLVLSVSKRIRLE